MQVPSVLRRGSPERGKCRICPQHPGGSGWLLPHLSLPRTLLPPHPVSQPHLTRTSFSSVGCRGAWQVILAFTPTVYASLPPKPTPPRMRKSNLMKDHKTISLTLLLAQPQPRTPELPTGKGRARVQSPRHDTRLQRSLQGPALPCLPLTHTLSLDNYRENQGNSQF